MGKTFSLVLLYFVVFTGAQSELNTYNLTCHSDTTSQPEDAFGSGSGEAFVYKCPGKQLQLNLLRDKQYNIILLSFARVKLY